MDLLNLVQWPAMATTIGAAWLIASDAHRRRNAGFWLFLLSNGLWVVWAWHVDAVALVILQAGLVVMNVRGALKTRARKATATVGGELAGARRADRERSLLAAASPPSI